jgi:hypothetical protein
MSDLERLLADYVAEHQAGGEADPRGYLARVQDDGQRAALAEDIDRYLMAAPRRPFDPAVFAASPSARIVDSLERALTGRAGLWPALLPQLRAAAGIRRAALVERLALALGVPGGVEKVGAYYHQMEQGSLSASGVSRRVLIALGEIVGETVDALRSAGESLAPPEDWRSAASPVFARTAGWSPVLAPEGATKPPDDQWDEVDELFRGGGRQS